MSRNIWGGTIFARERSDQARGSVATERGEGVGGGCPPPTVGSFFNFSTWKCAIWGIPKKEISTWRHVLYGYISVSRFDRPGKRYFFKNAETYLWKYAPKYNLRKISNTCQRYTKYYCNITYNINMKEVPRRKNEGTKRTSMERMWCGGVSFQCSFLLLLMA